MVWVITNFVSILGAIVWDLFLGIITYWASPHIRRRLSKANVDSLLKLTDRETNIILPVREGSINDIKSTALSWTFVTFDEALVINEIQKLLEDLYGANYSLKRAMLNAQNIDPRDNVMCIGGPMSTPETAKYFRTILHKVKFRWSNIEDQIRIKNFSDFIYVAEKNEAEGLTDNEIVIGDKMVFKYDQNNEGYVFLARFVGERASKINDFNDTQHGTVHILFGRNADCTLAAVKLLNTQRKALAKIIRQHKRNDHYVFLIKCLKTSSGIEVDFNQLYDITDICL